MPSPAPRLGPRLDPRAPHPGSRPGSRLGARPVVGVLPRFGRRWPLLAGVLGLAVLAGCTDAGGPDGGDGGDGGDGSAGGDGAGGDFGCPAADATARSEGGIVVSWGAFVFLRETDNGTAIGTADAYHVHRGAGKGPMERVATTQETHYVDEDTRPGQAYRYMVLAEVDGEVPESCPVHEATEVPSFPAAWAGILAAVAGVAAYVGLRWRR